MADGPDLLDAIDECRRRGFVLGVWHEWEAAPDGKKTRNVIEHLYIWDPEHPGRWVPRSLMQPLMARARVVRGYLRRERSRFFDGDRRTALACSEADDRRLREHGR